MLTMSKMKAQAVTSFDLRDVITFNEVENQRSGRCCFAFAVCGVIEVLHYMKKGEHIHLSTQDVYNHLVSNEKQNNDGNTIYATLLWIKNNGCLLAKDCPYVGTYCPTGYPRQPFVRIQNHFEIDLTKEMFSNEEIVSNKIENEIMIGPLVAELVWIDEMAKLEGDEIYSGPEKASAFKKAKLHFVMIVGYGEEVKKKKLTKYWIIRNSHGINWGNGGYGKIDRGVCHGILLIPIVWTVGDLVYPGEDAY